VKIFVPDMVFAQSFRFCENFQSVFRIWIHIQVAPESGSAFQMENFCENENVRENFCENENFRANFRENEHFRANFCKNENFCESFRESFLPKLSQLFASFFRDKRKKKFSFQPYLAVN
jgi:hypothetical protein